MKHIRHERRAAAIVISGALAATFCVTTPAVADDHSVGPARGIELKASGTPRLKVTVSNLPRSVDGDVVVMGPGGFRKIVRSSTTLDGLAPGKYRIRALPVKEVGVGQYDPTQQHKSLVVARGRTTNTEISYAAVRTKDARVAKISDVKSFTALSGKRHGYELYRVRLAGKYAPGNVVAADVSRTTPRGFLVRLLSRKSSSGGSTVFLARRARIDEALKSGRIESGWSGARIDHRAASTSRGRVGVSDQLWTGSQSASTSYGCVTGTATVTATVTASANADVSAAWGLETPFSMTLSADAQADVSATLTGTLAEKCALDPTELGSPIDLPPYTYYVGYLPIVFNPQLEFFVQGSMDLQESASITGTASLDTSFTATLSSAGLTTDFQPPTLDWHEDSPNLRVPRCAPAQLCWGINNPTFNVTGNAGFQIGPRVNLLVYGEAGIFADLYVGPQADITQITPSPIWQVNGLLSVQVGVLGNTNSWLFKYLNNFTPYSLNESFTLYTKP